MKQGTLLAAFLLCSIIGYSQMTGWQNAWTYLPSPIGHTAAYDIIQDRTGNLYAIGPYTDSYNRDQVSTVLLKYSSSGQLIWRKNFTAYGARLVVANNIAIDSLNRIYIAGNYGAYVSVNPPLADSNLLLDTVVHCNPIENGRLNSFLFCLDTSGKRLWSRFFSGTSGASIKGLSVNKMGQIAMIGTYADTLRLDTFSLTQPMGGQQRSFIARFDATGTLKMLRGAYTSNMIGSCYVNEKSDIFVSGEFSSWVQFDSIRLNSRSTGPVTGTGFVVKFDSAGKAKWVSGIFGHLPTQANFAGVIAPAGIIEQPNGNVAVTGYTFDCSASVGNGQFTLPYHDQFTPFIVCFNATGDPLWFKGTPGYGSASAGRLCSDSANNIYFTGSIYDPASWGGDTVSWGNTTSHTDAFLYKISPIGKLLWARFAGGSSHDYGCATALTKDQSQVYVAGFSGSPDSMNFGSFSRPTAGVFTLFVAKTGTAPLRVESLPQTAAFPVTLYPNPAGETLTAKLPEKLLLREVLMVDAAGQVRLQMSAPPAHGSEVRLPVGLLSPGQYFLVLTARDGSRAVQPFSRL